MSFLIIALFVSVRFQNTASLSTAVSIRTFPIAGNYFVTQSFDSPTSDSMTDYSFPYSNSESSRATSISAYSLYFINYSWYSAIYFVTFFDIFMTSFKVAFNIRDSYFNMVTS